MWKERLMPDRHAHLVGSIPAADPASAMRLAMDALGPLLRTLPDGETGERRNWIIHVIESLRSHPDLELAKGGDWSDYDRTPRLRIRRGHRLYGATLDFGHVAAVQDSLPAFEQVRAESGRDDLAFQVGVPGDFDMAMFALGPVGALRNRRPFTEATMHEMRRIHAQLGADVVFQIEVPAELVLLARAPRRARPALAGVLGREIAALAAGAPAGARLGVHLCLGDMNNKALGRMRDASPLVELSNAIVRRWPAGRALEYLHAPLAAGVEPAPTEASFYEPLTRLRMPPTVRFIAGFAHEARALNEQRRIRSLVEDRVGHPVDVAASCGLGRRTEGAAVAVMEQTAALCVD
jgi:hypothetical protein